MLYTTIHTEVIDDGGAGRTHGGKGVGSACGAEALQLPPSYVVAHCEKDSEYCNNAEREWH